MQVQVADCHTAADVWAVAARVRAWRTSLKPPIRRIPITCFDKPVVLPIIRPKPKPMPGLCLAKFVQETVAAHFGVTVHEILAKRRNPKVILPRHVAMYVTKHVSLQSFPEIGRRFQRDHTTVLHAVQKIERMIESDFDLKQTIENLISECKP